VALPADLRRRLHLDRADAQIKLVEHEDGRVELVPVVAIPADSGLVLDRTLAGDGT